MLDLNGYLITIFTFVSIMVSCIIFYYSESGTPWHTYMTVFLCYYSAFAILFMVPIDISKVIENRRNSEPNHIQVYEDDISSLRPIYKTFYLILTVQASVVLVIEEMYNSDGYFTPFAKFLSTIRRFIVDNFPYMVVGGIVFGILVGQGVLGSSNAAILLTIILISNTVNLLLLMFILGYGLIAYPQMLWQSANVENRLKIAQQNAVSQYKNFNDVSIAISQVVADVRKTKDQLGQYGDPKLNQAIEVILSECPAEFKSSTIGKVAINKNGQVTIDTLAYLRMQLNQARDSYRLAQGRLEETKLTAYTCEDIVNATKRTDGLKEIKWSFRVLPGKTLEYYWFITIRPLLLRLAAVGSAVLTILTFLGVIGSFKGVSESASTFYLIVQAQSTSGAACVLFILLTFGYFASVTYWAMFQIKLSGSMEMVPFRTTPESLSFNARLVARLSAPMAFFYLGFLFENGTSNGSWVYSSAPTNTTTFFSIHNQTYVIQSDYEMLSAFAKFYQIQVVPGMGDAFNTFFPALLIAVSFLVLTNIVNRILVALHLEAYQFGQEIVSDDQMRDGKRVLERQKKVMARTVERFNLKSAILGQTKSNVKHQDSGDIFASNESAVQSNTCWRRFVTSIIGSPSDGIQTIDSDVEEATRTQEPTELSGWVEKKGAKTFGLDGGFQKRYMVVVAPGILRYWKDNDITKEAHGEVDIKLVINFVTPPQKKGEAPRLDIELPDKVFKIRFLTDDDSSYWSNGLKSWKEFIAERRENVDMFQDNAKSTEKLPETDEDYDKIFNSLVIPAEKEKETRGFFGGKKKAKEQLPEKQEEVYIEKAPGFLEGWLEKKTHSAFGNTYQKRYFRVNEKTRCLDYAKSQKEIDTNPHSLEMNYMSDIVQDSTDTAKFIIDMGDKSFKLKTESTKEAERWIKGLNDWKDYLVLKMI